MHVIHESIDVVRLGQRWQAGHLSMLNQVSQWDLRAKDGNVLGIRFSNARALQQQFALTQAVDHSLLGHVGSVSDFHGVQEGLRREELFSRTSMYSTMDCWRLDHC